MLGAYVELTIRQAFILGAGLGTRLRPLTEAVPKPLIPLWNRPLLAYAMDHLRADAGTEAFLVNTHHCPEAYPAAFPQGRHAGATVGFRHEPVLLETGGGIANAADWLPRGEESFFVYNGDILSDLPLGPALAAHQASGALVTLVLRSRGEALQVAWDAASGQVADIRGMLGRGEGLPRFQFTGIYLVRPAFLDWLEPGVVASVIPAFLALIREGAGLGGVVIDEGRWSDLGNRASYLETSAGLAREPGFPRYGRQPGCCRLHPGARIDPGARLDEASVAGEGCEVGPGAWIEESILWPGAKVEAGTRLKRCVVRGGKTARGEAEGVDF